MKNILIAALVLNATAVGAALAGEKCNVPVAEWQPREALQAKLESDGWQIRSIKTEDGCYEAYAVEFEGKQGRSVFRSQDLQACGR